MAEKEKDELNLSMDDVLEEEKNSGDNLKEKNDKETMKKTIMIVGGIFIGVLVVFFVLMKLIFGGSKSSSVQNLQANQSQQTNQLSLNNNAKGQNEVINQVQDTANIDKLNNQNPNNPIQNDQNLGSPSQNALKGLDNGQNEPVSQGIGNNSLNNNQNTIQSNGTSKQNNSNNNIVVTENTTVTQMHQPSTNIAIPAEPVEHKINKPKTHLYKKNIKKPYKKQKDHYVAKESKCKETSVIVLKDEKGVKNAQVDNDENNIKLLYSKGKELLVDNVIYDPDNEIIGIVADGRVLYNGDTYGNYKLYFKDRYAYFVDKDGKTVVGLKIRIK